MAYVPTTTIYTPNIESFPTTGRSDVYYIAENTGKTYWWDGASYVQLLGQLDGLFQGKLLLTDKLVGDVLQNVVSYDVSLYKINIDAITLVQGVTLPSLTGVTTIVNNTDNIISNNPNLTSISMPALTSIAADFTIQYNPLLTSVNFPVLQELLSSVPSQGLYINNNTLLSSINLSSYQTSPSTVKLINLPSLTAVTLTAMTSGGVHYQSLPLLTTSNFPVLTSIPNNTFCYFQTCNSLVVTLPSLTGINNSCSFRVLACANTSLNLSGLTSIGSGGSFFVVSNPSLTSIDLSGLVSCNNNSLIISSNNSLNSLDLSALSALSPNNSFSILGGALVSIDLPELISAGNIGHGSSTGTTTINVPLLTNANKITVDNTSGLVSLSFPSLSALTDVNSGFEITDCSVLTSISHPILSEIYLYWIKNTLIASLDLSSFNAVIRNIFIEGNTSLVSLNTTPFTSIEQLNITDNTSLTGITLPNLTTYWIGANLNIYGNTSCGYFSLNAGFIPLDYSYITWNFSDNALDQTSVDLILSIWDASGVISTATLNLGNNQGYSLNVGTNSAPTNGILNTNYVSLVGKGWNIIIEP